MSDDVEAIRQVKARYFRLMDTKDWSGLASVFTPDVTIDVTSEGGGVTHSVAEYLPFLETAIGDVTTVHHGHMPEIELTSATTARAIWSFEDLLWWPPGGPIGHMHGFGHYHETYRKVEDGWRISSLKITRLHRVVDPPSASSRMSSYEQILNLIHRYPELIDAGDFAGVGELFRDATLVFEGSDGNSPSEVHGSAAVKALYEQTTRRYPDDGTPHTRHVITDPIVEVDDVAGTARCRYAITVFQRTDDFPLQPVWSNRYEDQLRRVDGQWRLERRRGFAHLPGDTSHHLLQRPDR